MTTSFILFLTGLVVLGMTSLTRLFIEDSEKVRDVNLIISAMATGIFIANLIMQIVG